jgi:hypothetical protein
MDLAAPKPGWATMLREHARLHATAALGLGPIRFGTAARVAVESSAALIICC